MTTFTEEVEIFCKTTFRSTNELDEAHRKLNELFRQVDDSDKSSQMVRANEHHLAEADRLAGQG